MADRKAGETEAPKRKANSRQLVAAQEALARRGNLDWLYTDAQKRMKNLFESTFDNVKCRLTVINVARQTGKTFFACAEALAWAIRHPGSTIFYASSKKKNLDQFVLPSFNKIIELLPKDVQPEYTIGKYKFRNGSTINTIGLDLVPDGGRGNTMDLYIFEEAGFINKLDYVYSSVVLPAMRRREHGKILMVSTPPETPQHPFKDFCVKASESGNYLCLPVTETDATEEQIARYEDECLTRTDFLREYMCEFVTDETLAVVPELTNAKLKNITRQEIRPGWFIPFVAGDLGYQDHTAFIFGYYDYRKHLIVIEKEWTINRSTTEYICEKVKEIELELWGKPSTPDKEPQRVVDGTSQQINDMCVTHEFNCRLPKKTDLIGRVNGLRELVKNEKIVFSPKLQVTPLHTQTATWTNVKKRIFAQGRGHHFDALAALIYFCEDINRYDDPRPYDWNYDGTKQYWKNAHNTPEYQEEKIIKDLFKL